jgi:hypothetical protein
MRFLTTLLAAVTVCLAPISTAPSPFNFYLDQVYLSNIKQVVENPNIPMDYNDFNILRVIPAGPLTFAKQATKSEQSATAKENELKLAEWHRDQHHNLGDFNILQKFSLVPTLLSSEKFGPKKCPANYFYVQDCKCALLDFSCGNSSASSCTSSSSSSSSSESCTTTESSSVTVEDIGTHAVASFAKQTNLYAFPSLEEKCKIETEHSVRSYISATAHTYILTKTNLVIIDCHCKKVKKIRHFFFNNEAYHGHDMLVNEELGFISVGFTNGFLAVYRICDLNVVYEGLIYDCLVTDDRYRLEYSVIETPDGNWNFYVIRQDGWDLFSMPLPLAQFNSRGDTNCPIFPIIQYGADAGCTIFNALVINDWVNDVDILVSQDGSVLKFLPVFYDSQLSDVVVYACSIIPVPDCVTGKLAPYFGVRLPYTNKIYLSFYPSLDLISATYTFVDTTKSAIAKEASSAPAASPQEAKQTEL